MSLECENNIVLRAYETYKQRASSMIKTCIAFSGDVKVMELEVREAFEPVEEKGIGVLCSNSIPELLQILWSIGVGESHSNRCFEEQEICNYYNK